MFNLSLTLFCRFGERKLRTKNLCMNSNSTIIKKNSKYPLRLLFNSIILGNSMTNLNPLLKTKERSLHLQ